MINPLFTKKDFNKFLDQNQRFSEDLRSLPIGLIDIGARGGVSNIFRPASGIFDVLGFEPDPLEVEKIMELIDENSKWASLLLEPIAVSDRKGVEELYILKHSVNSSMYPVNQEIFNRYKLEGFQLVKKISINTTTLDNLVYSGNFPDKNYGEILKIDTQGSELKILKGGARVLKERTCCILCEAAFFTPYENVTLFSELELFLRSMGFSFYGFLDFQQRSTKRINKVGKIGRERFMQADAIFFKDPLQVMQKNHDKTFNGRYEPLIIAALLFGYYDFAAELVDAFIEEKYRSNMFAGINDLAKATAKNTLNIYSEILQKNNLKTSNDLIELGKMVDLMRDFHTYHEVKKAK